MRKTFVLLVLSAAMLLCACSANNPFSKKITVDNSDEGVSSTSSASKKHSKEPVSQEVFAMDTYMTVTAYGDNASQAVEKAIEKINELDEALSTGKENSQISKLNTEKKASLSDEVFYLVKSALDINKKTNGLFDPAIYPLMEEWGFTDQHYKVPDENTISNLLNEIDASGITIDESSNEVSLLENTKIDLGGIAKGYTSDCIMDIFKECGVEHGMVSLGGNVELLGTKTDGSDWRVGIQHPTEDSGYLGILTAKDKAVITSGGYERYFEEDGVTYHHIIDPRDGYPANNGLTSVTIVSESGILADALSTSLFIMGKDEAIKYWRENADDFDIILYTDDGKLYVSEGIRDNFTSDYEITKVSR